ncbi:MAG: DoxX family protein [Chitinophaga sp.]|uniref:DoxX family protein n=1 Tax=Chitinophaga sp. TaxID=1869181 RepID=UPI0025B88189|nr:DoxX family protein [Chitinophaga sp.]MBV8256025.1 DoxX family protein [Chitinophaga sp.]
MKSESQPLGYSYLLIRLIPGLVFLSEGIQKFLLPVDLGPGRFEKIGFPQPEFWAYFTACFEIICGLLLIIGLLVRLATIPLLIVMIVAFIATKVPILEQKGFWAMAHEYRTDFAMTMILIFLLINGAGKFSMDHRLARMKRKRMFNRLR